MIDWAHFREGLDPQFAADMDEAYGKKPYTLVIVYGRRANAEQAHLRALYLAGKGGLAAPAGHSAHEWGYATDFDIKTADGRRLNWQEAHHPEWQDVWTTARAHPRLHTGHDFPPVADADDDHIQSKLWYAKRRALIHSGQW